jgi:hypothetical protein
MTKINIECKVFYVKFSINQYFLKCTSLTLEFKDLEIL